MGVLLRSWTVASSGGRNRRRAMEWKPSNSPPKLGGGAARTAKRQPDRAKPEKKSEQPGRFWLEPPRLASLGTPPNLGAEYLIPGGSTAFSTSPIGDTE